MADEISEETPQKKGWTPLVIALMGGLVVGGGLGYGAAGMAASGELDGLAEDGGAAALRAPIALGGLQINLRGSSHVARIDLAADIALAKGVDVESLKPRLRDQVVSVASDYTRADIEGMAGKNRLRDELHGRMNTVLDGAGTVENLYFSQFVVQ